MEKAKKTIAGLGVAAALAGAGVGLEDTYHKDIYLKATDKMYSGMEYRQERKSIGDKGSADNLDWNGLQLYVEILNREKDKCGGKLFTISSKEDIRNLVKKFDKGCPK